MSAVDMHESPILMRTVLWIDGHCIEKTCAEESPIDELENDKDRGNADSSICDSQERHGSAPRRRGH